MVHLTVVTEDGSTFPIDVDLSMELENVMALLEADVCSHTPSVRPRTSLAADRRPYLLQSNVPVDDQLLFYNGRHLTGLKESLEVRRPSLAAGERPRNRPPSCL